MIVDPSVSFCNWRGSRDSLGVAIDCSSERELLASVEENESDHEMGPAERHLLRPLNSSSSEKSTPSISVSPTSCVLDRFFGLTLLDLP